MLNNDSLEFLFQQWSFAVAQHNHRVYLKVKVLKKLQPFTIKHHGHTLSSKRKALFLHSQLVSISSLSLTLVISKYGYYSASSTQSNVVLHSIKAVVPTSWMKGECHSHRYRITLSNYAGAVRNIAWYCGHSEVVLPFAIDYVTCNGRVAVEVGSLYTEDSWSRTELDYERKDRCWNVRRLWKQKVPGWCFHSGRSNVIQCTHARMHVHIPSTHWQGNILKHMKHAPEYSKRAAQHMHIKFWLLMKRNAKTRYC